MMRWLGLWLWLWWRLVPLGWGRRVGGDGMVVRGWDVGAGGDGGGSAGGSGGDMMAVCVWALSLCIDVGVEVEVVAGLDFAVKGGESGEGGGEIVAAVVVETVLSVDVVEDDDGDLCVTQDGKLHGLFEETVSTLGEGDLSIAEVLDALDADLLAAHCGMGRATVSGGRGKEVGADGVCGMALLM